MNLSDIIVSNMGLIIKEWGVFAETQKHTTREYLTDSDLYSRREILEEIVKDLSTAQSLTEQKIKSQGLAQSPILPKPAELAASYCINLGIGIGDMIAQYRALRAHILQLWLFKNNITISKSQINELIRFNEAIDEAIAGTVMRYVKEKEKPANMIDFLLSSSPDENYILEPNFNLKYINTSGKSRLVKSSEECIGGDFFKLYPKIQEFKNELYKWLINEKKPFILELPHQDTESEQIILEYIFTPTLDENGSIASIVVLGHDITQRKIKTGTLYHQANYDYLTDLPNKRLFTQRVEEMIKKYKRNNQPFSLLFIDLDGFKKINDTQGHHIGDMLLKAVSTRLIASVRKIDFVSRLSGDEFCILIPSVINTSIAQDISNKITASISRPFSISNKIVQITCSIGIAHYPDDAESVQTLIDQADEKMYSKKNLKNMPK